MRYLSIAISLSLIFPFCAYGQVKGISCESTFSDKGTAFEISDPQSLEGVYHITIVPTWDAKASTASGELHLYWEERYIAMQNVHTYRVPQQFPLVGYITGDFRGATILNFNEKMGRKDPLNPGVRFYDDLHILKIPGDEAVDPECPDCINICTDCPTLTFKFEKMVDGIIVGSWSHDLGFMATKNSEGISINRASGYFCAEPQN